MKKMLSIMLVVAAIISCFYVFAQSSEQLMVNKVQYPVKINGVEVEKELPMFDIEDRVYVPIRALCENLDVGINWNEKEKAVEIMTNKVKSGYDGIEEWNRIDLDITEETAIKIADAIFLQHFGEDFVNTTKMSLYESDNKKSFRVFRYKESVLGGDYTIVIRKSDGKIEAITAGE